MKKITLEFEDLQSWFTIGISCQLPDYKLLFRINKVLKTNFSRVEDFKIDVAKFKGNFSVYWYFDNINQVECFLISNRNEAKVLLNEFKQLDYFLIIRDEFGSELLEEYKGKIKEIKEVLFTQIIDIESIKNYAALAEAFEIHIDKIADWRGGDME